MKKQVASQGQAAPELISQRIAELGDWRGRTLARMRALIGEADPEVVEEWKWVKATSPGTPVWSHAGIICTGETYRNAVKLTFARGASLKDPAGLFNASLDGRVRRAIDIHEGEEVNAVAFKALIREAVALNEAGRGTRGKPPSPRGPAGSTARASATKKAGGASGGSAPKKAGGAGSGRTKPVLLAGGNPQIAKADGDAPVQAYIAAMPGWKRAVARRLDALIERTVPGVRKAVKWNSPFYGVEGRGWFLSLHAYTHYVKVAFFRGRSLRPLPPGESRQKDVRYVDIREEPPLDEAQMASWLRQAADLPGWTP